MNYEEFLTEAKETLTMLLSEDYPGISVEPVNVDKLQNSSYRGLSIREAGMDVAMTMDMMPVFEEIQEGHSKELVLGSFARQIREHMEEMPIFDVTEIRNYEVMKENLSIQMVSIQGNEKMLSDVPHKVMADLAAVYRIQVGRDAAQKKGSVYCGDIDVLCEYIARIGDTLNRIWKEHPKMPEPKHFGLWDWE